MLQPKGHHKEHFLSRAHALHPQSKPRKLKSKQVHNFKSNSTIIQTVTKEFSFPSVFPQHEDIHDSTSPKPMPIKVQDSSSESDWYEMYQEEKEKIKQKQQNYGQKEKKIKKKRGRKPKKEREKERKDEEEKKEVQENNFIKFKIKLKDYEGEDYRIVRVNKDEEEKIIFKVENRNGEKSFISNEEMKVKYPQTIISYYERKIKWPSNH